MRTAAPPQLSPRSSSMAGQLFLGGIVGIGIMIVMAHGCHGPDEDYEPIIAPPLTSLAEESANESRNP